VESNKAQAARPNSYFSFFHIFHFFSKSIVVDLFPRDPERVLKQNKSKQRKPMPTLFIALYQAPGLSFRGDSDQSLNYLVIRPQNIFNHGN